MDNWQRVALLIKEGTLASEYSERRKKEQSRFCFKNFNRI
jgi:hypothetical protein